VKRLLEWWKDEIGVYLLSDLTKALIVQQRDKLLNTKSKYLEKRTPSTVNRYVTAFGHALTIATNEWEWINDHSMRKIGKLSEPRGRIRYLDDTERKIFLQACRETDEYLYLLVVLALSTGARHGELINLRWKDIDFTRQVIVLHDTKNKERRLLPLTHHALNLMTQHSSSKTGQDSFVFPSADAKKPWSSRTPWLKALKKSHIQNVRFHDLRHSAASYLAMNGASLAEIAEVLGHKTLSMVKRYAHLSEAHTAKVVQRMNERIFE
jgi:integrase